MSETAAQAERAALADSLAEVGPDRPTLCDGWTTQDLAAHVILRDRRPDAAAGILLKPFAGHMAKVQAELAVRPYEELVGLVREVPWFSPVRIGLVDDLINTQEFFIHTEDVRRAQPDWQPRPLARALGEALWSRAYATARISLRRFPAALVLEAPGYGEAGTGAGGEALRLTGDPGELTLFLSGRQRVARVELDGPAELAERLRTKRLGI
jgi:uncharacterized protein (TIGR03085 family)